MLFLPSRSDRQGEGGLRLKGLFKTSLKDRSLITIITVVYNGCQFLEETILSVINQTYDNVEYIIIDGGSADGSLDIIRKYENKIDYWVSEPDSGIYNAMNKGLDLATGDWINFMNAGDYFASSSCLKDDFLVTLRKNEGFLLYGFAIVYDTGEVVYPVFNWKILLHNTLHHQGTFYSKKLFDVFRYDASLRAISDYELNLKAFLTKVKVHLSQQTIAVCEEGGVSRTDFSGFIKETNTIRSRYVPSFINYLIRLS